MADHTRSAAGDPFRVLAEQAMEELRLKTAVIEGTVKLSAACWGVDQDQGRIQFLWPGGILAVAPVQIIGTYNTADGTWLWAWENPSIVDSLQGHAKTVREYGREHGLDRLSTRKLACPEDDCWEFAAIASKLCGAQGAYRGPAGDTRVFMTFGELELSKVF